MRGVIHPNRIRRLAFLGRSGGAILLGALLASAVSGCTTVGASTNPSTPATATPTPSASASERAASGGVGTAVGQTDTDWGRIWDTLPKGFPSVPGATTADEGAAGPASANLVVQGTDAKGVATGLQGFLTQAGYSTIGLSGPLENGGFVLDMSGSPSDCRLRVTATPTGSLTTVTVLYGASCPHD
jgi:hypothetical protein